MEYCDRDPEKSRRQRRLLFSSLREEGNNRLLLLSLPGTGKTAASLLAVDEYLSKGYDVFVATMTVSIDSYKRNIERQQGSIKKFEIQKTPGITGFTAFPEVERFGKIFVSTNQGTIKLLKNIKNGDYRQNPYVIVVDEVHKFTSNIGMIYQSYHDIFHNLHPDSRVLLMTGSVGKPLQLALLMNLLTPLDDQFDISNFNEMYVTGKVVDGEIEMHVRNSEHFMYKVQGYCVSYQGISDAFPEVYKHYLEVPMGDDQDEYYQEVLSTYRNETNYVFPWSGLLGEAQEWSPPEPSEPSEDAQEGMDSSDESTEPVSDEQKKIKRSDVLKASNVMPMDTETYDIGDVSGKAEYLLDLIISKKIKFPCYIYSYYREFGVDFLTDAFRTAGFGEYFLQDNEIKHRRPKRNMPTFVTIAGSEKKAHKLIEHGVKMYNSQSNTGGKNLDIFMSTSTASIGISLFKTRTEIIFEATQDITDTKQATFRGIRQCSHLQLPESEQNIDVYYLMSSSSSVENVEPEILKSNQRRLELMDEFMTLVFQVAVDCRQHYKGNEDTLRKLDEGDLMIKCRKFLREPKFTPPVSVPRVEYIAKRNKYKDWKAMYKWIEHCIVFRSVRRIVFLSITESLAERFAEEFNMKSGSRWAQYNVISADEGSLGSMSPEDVIVDITMS